MIVASLSGGRRRRRGDARPPADRRRRGRRHRPPRRRALHRRPRRGRPGARSGHPGRTPSASRRTSSSTSSCRSCSSRPASTSKSRHLLTEWRRIAALADPGRAGRVRAHRRRRVSGWAAPPGPWHCSSRRSSPPPTQFGRLAVPAPRRVRPSHDDDRRREPVQRRHGRRRLRHRPRRGRERRQRHGGGGSRPVPLDDRRGPRRRSRRRLRRLFVHRYLRRSPDRDHAVHDRRLRRRSCSRSGSTCRASSPASPRPWCSATSASTAAWGRSRA